MSQLALCGCCKNAMDAAEHNSMHGGLGGSSTRAEVAVGHFGSSPPGLPCLRPHPPSQAQAKERIPSQVLLLYVGSKFFGTGKTLYLVPEFFGAFAV